MNEQIRRFITQFRELEKKQAAISPDEHERWLKLKEKLVMSAPQPTFNSLTVRKIIVVASLYSQAGASFVASNYAYLQAGKEVLTTLCEVPGAISYNYFAFDVERRAKPAKGIDQDHRLIILQSGFLYIKTSAALDCPEMSQAQLMNWLLHNQRGASLTIIDLSCRWREEAASWIMQLADEVWFIIDTDIPRITRLVGTEKAPTVWTENFDKIKIIANKWNKRLKTQSAIKRVEGTLSLWDIEQKGKKVESFLPYFDGDKVSEAILEARVWLEKYPEEKIFFEQLEIG